MQLCDTCMYTYLLWILSLDLFLFNCFAVNNANFMYRKVASFNTSHLEAHVGLFRLLMKEIFNLSQKNTVKLRVLMRVTN